MNAAGYRLLACSKRLFPCHVLDEETDMLVLGKKDLTREAANLVREARCQVKGYIAGHPDFRDSLVPCAETPDAQPVVKAMIDAGHKAELGPMAAVAGAIAEFVGRRLGDVSDEIIIENGGDVFFRTNAPQKFAIVAETASSALVSIEISELVPGAGMGVCTSSGKLGPSKNFGNADAVTVIARSAALADALATAASNRIRSSEDIAPALEWATRHGAEGVVALAFDRVAAMGSVKFSD